MTKYSVIIVLEEKNKGFSEYVRALNEIFSSRQESYEILVIANGVGEFLGHEQQNLLRLGVRLKAFTFNRRTSQAVCLRAALKESKGRILFACSSYQQIGREAIVQLLDSFDDQTDVISPWRQNRVDPWFNQFQSRVFNGIVRRIARSSLHDLSCTVRMFRREVLEETELYGGMYRFLPILAAQKGFKCKEVACEHYHERGKTGFYGLSEYLSRIIDIFTLYFNWRFTRKPLRFFSTVGFSFLFIGMLTTLYVFGQRVIQGSPIGGRPVLLLAILFMVLGVQAAGAGLLGEVITFTHGRKKKEYTIEKVIR